MKLGHTVGFILDTVLKDTELRYKGSLLGVLWLFLPALVSILLYSLVFSQLMHSRLPGSSSPFAYSIYLCAGLLIWNFFADVLQKCTTAYAENANILKKSRFNKLSLIVIATANASIQFFIISGVFVVFLLASGALSAWGLASYFIAWLLVLALALPLGALAAMLNIFFRDVGHLTQIALQALFWFTPIVYPASILPARVQQLIALNPLAYPVRLSQSGMLSSTVPDPLGLVILLAVCTLLTLGVVSVHRALASDFLDEL